MNRGIKVLGVCVVAVGVAAVLVPIALQGMVADSLAARIAAATGVPTRIGSARLGFFPQPHIAASDIQFGAPGGAAPLTGTISGLAFDLSFGSLIGGPVAVSDIALDRPALVIRRTGAAPVGGRRDAVPAGVSLDGLTVTDGSFSYIDDNRQARAAMSKLSFRVTAPAAGAPLTLAGTAALGGTAHDWRLSVQSPDALRGGRDTAVDAEIGAPGSPDAAVLHGHVRVADGRLNIPDAALTAGGASASGSGDVDFSAAAPMITAALKVRRVDLGALPMAKQGAAVLPTDRSGVRLSDAAITLDIDEATAGPLKATAIQSRVTLVSGLMRVAVTDAKLSGGTLRAEAAVDAAQALPRPTLHASVAHVDVAPLLAGVVQPAQFSGRLDVDMNLSSAGSSRDELVPNLAGTARFAVLDAAITGIDVPGYIRSVASYLPPAWQRMTTRVDIQTLTVSFQIAKGVATTSDFHAVSPVVELTGKGDVDLNAQSFDLSFDPKIAVDPAPTPGRLAPGAGGLGVAILVQGPWAAPRLSADISKAMRDPQQTLDTLQTLGQQMLGGTAGTGGAIQPEDIMKGLGGLFGGMREGRQASSGAPHPQSNDTTGALAHGLRNLLDAR